MDKYIRKKIYIEEDKHDKFKELSSEGGPFSSMKDVFMAAAILGYNLGEMKSLKPNEKRDIFDKDVFDEHDLALLYAVVIAYYKDVTIIEHDPLGEVEKFANAGIEELYKLVNNDGEGIVNLVEEILIKYS
ncbi:hypothetical protein BBF96_01360 [Anoxybacter fermentans]|uniref:Uncharacterized protein n=1 Tax=Anoxybacter fermentans TaxID=1323375 RepID=A0A3Q9HNM3_9FIRM|nr:hypothetical protein [Anoxybacter fermentans]AZR72158.1 hypothetical protein BBF96_01360 [Anoxybacter fermentans]